MKKKNLFIILALMFFLVLPINVQASKVTCKYRYEAISIDVIYTYEYGVNLKYTTSNKNKSISSNPLSNNDFVNQETGDISCPKLKFSSTTVAKGRWEVSVRKDSNGVSGELTILVNDNKEKEAPSSNNRQCNYKLNGLDTHTYSLLWDGSSVRVTLYGNIEGYDTTIQNCDASSFANGCPNVYDQLVAKGNQVIIDCKNKIFSDNDQTNSADSSINVDTGSTTQTPNNNNSNQNSNNDFKDKFIGNTTCGGITSFKFHERVPKLTSLVYNLIKLSVPIILIIMGMMDMFKAMSAGKEDEMKKAQKKFINRLIAGICAFLVFILVETVIGWISTATDNQGAMDCVNCFINGPKDCQTLE